MAFITRTFNVKKCITKLRRQKGVNQDVVQCDVDDEVTPTVLDPYIYKNLFMPIVWNGEIPLNDIDITRITDADINALHHALYNSSVPEYLELGLAFQSLEPSAQTVSPFIL